MPHPNSGRYPNIITRIKHGVDITYSMVLLLKGILGVLFGFKTVLVVTLCKYKTNTSC